MEVVTEVSKLWRPQEDRPFSYACITAVKFMSLALVSSKMELPVLRTVLLLRWRFGDVRGFLIDESFSMELSVVYICLLRLLEVKAICLGRLIFTLGRSMSASRITVESLIIYSMCRLIWPPRPGSALIYSVLSTVVYGLPSLSSIELKSAWLLWSSNS